MIRRPPRSTRTDTLFPYTTLFRSLHLLRLPADATLTAAPHVMADQQHRYRAENPASIAVHHFDELTLLYHRSSGITHMVIAPAPQLLAVTGSEELAVADILTRMSQAFGMGKGGQESVLAVLCARVEE